LGQIGIAYLTAIWHSYIYVPKSATGAECRTWAFRFCTLGSCKGYLAVELSMAVSFSFRISCDIDTLGSQCPNNGPIAVKILFFDRDKYRRYITWFDTCKVNTPQTVKISTR